MSSGSGQNAAVTERHGYAAGDGRAYYEYLDGVRGLAAVYVVAHHIWRAYTTVALGGVLGLATNWLLYGHLAVDVFIVLSGFCLMLPVARSRSLRGGWRRFYAGRARRILPPLYAAIAVAMVEMTIHHYPPPPAAMTANFLLLQDFWQSQNFFDPPLWSVAVECKIYLLFPALVWLWLRFGVRALVLTAGVLGVLFCRGVMHIPTVTDVGLVCPWYIFLFAMGMAGADCAARRGAHGPGRIAGWSLAGALAALAAMLWAWPVTAAGEGQLFVPHLPIIDAAAGLAAALLLTILCGHAIRGERTAAIRWFSWKPLVFLGSIAYSLYLVHVFVIYELKNALVYYLPFHPPWLIIPMDLAAAVLVAWLFHLVFERPFMSRRRPRNEREAERAAALNPAP